MTSIYAALVESLRHNDLRTFRGILETEGLPRGAGQWLDYDLLTKAIKFNRKRMVGYLLDKNCRVVKPETINTPLHLAVEKLGWCKVVEKMLNLGARVTDINCNGDTVLHAAFKSKASEFVVDLLLKRYLTETTEDVFDKDGLGFMHIACTRPNIQIVKEFFDTGKADMYGQAARDCGLNYAGYTPLHFAVEYGRHEMAKFLCQYEAEIYQQDHKGSTPIHLALEKRDPKMISTILYYDSKHVNCVNNLGLTHFMAACAVGDVDVIEEYLCVAYNSGTLPRTVVNSRVKDIKDYQFAGYTPLHFAAEFGRFNTVKGLLETGAQDSALTTLGFTPYALANRMQNRQICWLFQQWIEYIDGQIKMPIEAVAESSYVNAHYGQAKQSQCV